MTINNGKFAESPNLTLGEKMDIERQIEFEITKSHFSMIKLGSITNYIAGLFVIWTLHKHVLLGSLLSWYGALVLFSTLDILWAMRYDINNITYDQLLTWRKGFYLIFGGLCLTWGGLGFLFVPNDIHYQIYTVAFLLAVLIGFSFSSTTDFTLACISIFCLLIPTIVYRIYHGIHNVMVMGADNEQNFGISAALAILGGFLFVACLIGSRIIDRFFRLNFENIALNQKLEDMNKSLEKRVRERTIELEDSLNLVTYQATHDLLTDLPNQRLLLEYINKSIQSASTNNHSFAVIFFSINEVEKINDGLGYQAGDLVIQTIAKRFQVQFNKAVLSNHHASRYTVTLSRKDIFVILLDPVFTIEEIEQGEILFSVLEESVFTGNQTVKLTASIGVSLYPRDGLELKSLLMNADAAMLRAKQLGGNNLSIYHADINLNISKQLEIERNLHEAVRNDEFVLQYQPVVDVQTGEICAVEALVRWNSPVLGFISPDNFIPLAEANGIIIPLGEWVLRSACKQTQAWHTLGFSTLKVAINISAKQLSKRDIAETLKEIIEEACIEPTLVEFELTESEAFKEEVIPTLKKFTEMGIGLSIDDFGTGYSGLTNLKLFKIATLKIDRSFVKDIETSEDSRAIVANTITLAKKINVKIIAEGVETKEQLKFLKEQGCDMIQGYYFSPPLSAESFTSLLESKKIFST